MRILTLIFLLFALNSNAQNFKLIEVLKRVPTKERAVQISNEMVAMIPTKYRLFTTKESQNAGILRMRYIPAELTDAAMEKGSFTEKQRASFITIDFSFYNAGEDINAQRPEVITYKLNEITAMYPELFVIWKNYFKPEAEIEITKTDYKSQHLKMPEKKIDIYIFQTETGWALRNLSLM